MRVRIRLMWMVAAMVGCCMAPARGEVPKSVLGMEPGERRLCNDDIGVIVWGPDTAPTLSVGKSDVWDRRNPAPPQPVMTMSKIVELAKVGDKSILNGAAYYTAYGLHDFPCPKPVGQVIIQLNFLRDGGKLTEDTQSRRVRLVAVNGAKHARLDIFVSSSTNLVVIQGEGTGLAAGDIAIRVYRHRDTIVPGGELHPTLGEHAHSPQDFEALPMPRAGNSTDMIWVAQDFGVDPTFPSGFTSALALRVVGTTVSTDVAQGQKNLGTPLVTEKEGRLSHGVTKRFTPMNEAPGSAATAVLGPINGDFTAFVAVTTTQDDADPLARARRDLDAAAQAGATTIWSEHTARLDEYERRPHARAWSADGKLKLDAVWGGVPYTPRPAGYYGDVPVCSVDSTKFCTQDSSMWHADFHFNEIDATGLCMQRQFDTLDSYFRMMNTLLPMAQANAREVYGCSGAMYPLAHYPLKSASVIHTHLAWEQSMEITALLIRPFWQRFLYTWDMTFLRDMAYPPLREGARFYADYLKRDADGLYHVFPTVSPEHRGITKNLEFNRDTQSGITLIRYHLRSASRAAALLGVDGEEAARWRDIAEHMPPYPLTDSPEGPIFVDVAGAKPIEYNIAVPLSAVFWGDDIGLDSSPDQIELMKRTLRQINVWVPHRGYLNRTRTRLGICEPDASIGLENLLQSHTGTIRVFPAVPEGFEGGFENLGAQGGFIVSATRDAHGVKQVSLTSLAGNPCRFANPWGTGTPRVRDARTGAVVTVALEGGALCFDTIPGVTYHIENAAQ